MARFRSVEIGVLLAALVAGASAWLVGCEPSRSSSSRKENALQVDNIRKDESDSSADRGSGAVTASAAPSKTEEAARPEPSRAEGENKSDSPKGDGKENTDEGGGIVVRDAKTGKAVTGFKIEKLDPNKKRVIPPNPIPQPDPNPSSIEGLKAVTTESGLKYWDIKVGEGEVNDFTALGDTINVAARLQAEAKAGEIIMSEALYGSVVESYPDLEQRVLQLRGRHEPMEVRVLRPDTGR